jgi:hypothetical protein
LQYLSLDAEDELAMEDEGREDRNNVRYDEKGEVVHSILEEG